MQLSYFANILKEFVLPGWVYKLLLGLVAGWHGTYKSFSEAAKYCSSYSNAQIALAVFTACAKTKERAGTWERDGVVFDQVAHSSPLTVGLSMAACAYKKSLHVLDFGGGFGSSYYQNVHLLRPNLVTAWDIVEQASYITLAKTIKDTSPLQYFTSVTEAEKTRKHHVLILSSVLQYLEHPYTKLHELLSLNFNFVIVDRTRVSITNNDYVSVQRVPKSIYGFKTSYPCWALSQGKLLSIFRNQGYSLKSQFTSRVDTSNRFHETFLGYIFERGGS